MCRDVVGCIAFVSHIHFILYCVHLNSRDVKEGCNLKIFRWVAGWRPVDLLLTLQLTARIIFRSEFSGSLSSTVSCFSCFKSTTAAHKRCAPFVFCCCLGSATCRQLCRMLWCSTCFVGLLPRLWPDKIFTFNVQTGNQSESRTDAGRSASVQLADWRFERSKARQTLCALTMITAGGWGGSPLSRQQQTFKRTHRPPLHPRSELNGSPAEKSKLVPYFCIPRVVQMRGELTGWKRGCCSVERFVGHFALGPLKILSGRRMRMGSSAQNRARGSTTSFELLSCCR